MVRPEIEKEFRDGDVVNSDWPNAVNKTFREHEGRLEKLDLKVRILYWIIGGMITLMITLISTTWATLISRL